ncbi:glycerophosphodiester phosphodiesterase domain-containing protein 5 [Elysia marginata]|uniref:Glycerophosphodiester phosphodiesterase domain-containing protein 5 n=1 Tax=Elysia marginata TaxID=1093978 RepID=A0AAV4IKU9_9GAST|nr:glycerophosphodiester phosphodiesterase domain-containing protein 5 [Elysia marginata]
MFQRVGKYIPWYGLGLGFSSATFACLSVILVLCILHVIHGHQLYIHLFHVVFCILALIACVVVSILIDLQWSHMWPLMYLALKVFGPFLQVTAVIVLTVLSWLLIRQWFRLMSKTSKAMWMSVFVAGMTLLYLSPLAVDTPVFRFDTPPKPQIVAIGGASDVSPENTMFAFEKAVALGARKLYSSVQISYDGVPFLMFDHSLLRTTNVESVFPNATSLDPAHHTMADLRSLSAGSWFLKEDPWGTKDDLSNSDKLQLEEEKIPTLASLARLVAAESEPVQLYLSVRNMPSWHPFRAQRFRRVMDVLTNLTSLRHSDVFVPPEIYQLDQSFGLFAPPSSSVWDSTGLDKTNETNNAVVFMSVRTDLEDVIDRFRARNVSTLVMGVKSSWFLSYVWCADVDLVATHYIQQVEEVDGSIIHMNEDGYLAMWVTADVISIVLILVMYIVQRIRLYGTNFSPEAISLSTGRVRTSHRSRTMKEKLLRDGAVMDTLDDADVSVSGGAGGPAALDHHQGEVGGEDGPAYSTTSSLQTYSLTTLPPPPAMSSSAGGHRGYPLHQMTASASDGDVGLSPPMTTLDRYSV